MNITFKNHLGIVAVCKVEGHFDRARSQICETKFSIKGVEDERFGE